MPVSQPVQTNQGALALCSHRAAGALTTGHGMHVMGPPPNRQRVRCQPTHHSQGTTVRYSQEATCTLQPGGHTYATARRLHMCYSQEATCVLQPGGYTYATARRPHMCYSQHRTVYTCWQELAVAGGPSQCHDSVKVRSQES